nr:DUF1259 domain-containing protein [Tumebacillus avium]
MATSSLCRRFGEILGAPATEMNGVCTVMRSRNNIRPVVLGKRGRSFLLTPQMFTFESIDRNGRALCSGETVILQEEINRFTSKLREHGIKVTAIHNHWLFDRPRLYFMHFEKIDRPLNFARDVKDALGVLTTRTVSGTRRSR